VTPSTTTTSWQRAIRLCAAAAAACTLAACAVPPGTPGNALVYRPGLQGLAAIPLPERDLPTAIAEPYFKVGEGGGMALEGPAFDRAGNLFFLDIYAGRVLKLTPDRQLTAIHTDKDLHPAGIAIHKDGRIFIAALGAIGASGTFEAGSVIALDANGGNRQVIVPASAKYLVDDVAFDNVGGIYFTDFRGTSTQPDGGVYYVSPDFRTVNAVIPKLGAANGIAVSPDSKVIWASEFATGRIHRADMMAPGVLGRWGTSIPYQFIGRAPDSMRTDADGNLYVAAYHQGRLLVLSPGGVPIGQILLPGREDDKFLKVTSMAFVPGTNEMVILARDELKKTGAMIFKAKGFAKGPTMFSHQ
jgi:lactonase